MPYYRRHFDDSQVHRRWIDPRLSTVHPANIRNYLRRKGWNEVAPDRSGVLVFEEPIISEDGPLYQWVPNTEDRRDCFQAIYELPGVLAEIEDRYAGDVLTDILEHSDTEAGSANGPRTPGRADPVSK